MIRLTVVMAVLAGIFFSSTAHAVQPGKTVTWDTLIGKVVFNGKSHYDAGVKCLDCHSKIFKMTKGPQVRMKMADINEGKYCGKCHNGTKAFAATDASKCVLCHKGK